MIDPDSGPRVAAFTRLNELTARHGGAVPWHAIEAGFEYGDQHFKFASRAEGIFKPKGFTSLLSVKTVVPKPKRRIWYEDQGTSPSYDDSVSGDVFSYAFTGQDQDDARNRWLREAMELDTPVIYFVGVAPGVYDPIFPVFVVGWDPIGLSCKIAMTPDQRVLQVGEFSIPPERSYAMRQVRARLHQSAFRERVLHAYDRRCALSGLPEISLIDAAHIIRDGDAELGQPDVRNGICMSKIHHAAFDSGLIGIDPDYKIHISERLLELHDGPMLEFGLKALQGTGLRKPDDQRFWPDRQRLEIHFARYRASS